MIYVTCDYPSAALQYAASLARTQKARGVVGTRSVVNQAGKLWVAQAEADVDVAWGQFMTNYGPFTSVFARPCPLRPRHGFVESRIVKSLDEIKTVWRELREADPEGELILMAFVQAEASAIVTPTMIAIGTGTDGATAGRAGCLQFPVAYVDLSWCQAAVGPDHSPFVEYLFKGAEIRCVQVRAGPHIPVSTAVVPADVLVTDVVRAEGDLIEWEHKLVEFVGRPGLVVWQPGGTVLSHYAVHAFAHKIPIVFTETPPRVGTRLKKTAEERLPRWSSKRFLAGVNCGLGINLSRTSSDDGEGHLGATAMSAVVYALHHVSALLRIPDGAYLIGFACALLLKLGAAACVGEYRHALESGPFPCGRARHQVYTAMLGSPTQFVATFPVVGAARWSFTNLLWGGSYGGVPWAICTEATLRLFNMLKNNGSSVYDRTAVIHLLNQIINLAHNNGWWLNKYGSSSIMDQMAAGQVETTLAGAYAFWTLLKRSTGEQHDWLGALNPPIVEPDAKVTYRRASASATTVKVNERKTKFMRVVKTREAVLESAGKKAKSLSPKVTVTGSFDVADLAPYMKVYITTGVKPAPKPAPYKPAPKPSKSAPQPPVEMALTGASDLYSLWLAKAVSATPGAPAATRLQVHLRVSGEHLVAHFQFGKSGEGSYNSWDRYVSKPEVIAFLTAMLSDNSTRYATSLYNSDKVYMVLNGKTLPYSVALLTGCLDYKEAIVQGADVTVLEIP